MKKLASVCFFVLGFAICWMQYKEANTFDSIPQEWICIKCYKKTEIERLFVQLFESLNKDMTLLSQENCMYTFSLNTSVRVGFLAFSILIQDWSPIWYFYWKLQYCFNLLLNCTKNWSKLAAFTVCFLKLRFVLANSFTQFNHSETQ